MGGLFVCRLCFGRIASVVTIGMMKETIEYKFAAPADRRKQARLQVVAPSDFVAGVLKANTQRGGEFSRRPEEAIAQETNNQDGTSTIDFLHTGMVGDWQSRLGRVLHLVTFLDSAAKAFDFSDPRIHLSDALGKRHGFGISFERPSGTDDEVLEKLRVGMTTAAKYLQGNIAEAKAAASIAVGYDHDLGFRLHTHGQLIASSVWQVNSPTSDRIEVSGSGGGERGRAITFAGVVAALDPIETTS